MMITHSHVHHMIDLCKKNQYWCKYKKDTLTQQILFHLFNIQRTSANSNGCQGLISSKHGKKKFKVYVDSLKNFKDVYYLVCPLLVMLTSICEIRDRVPSRYVDKFPKFWDKITFLWDKNCTYMRSMIYPKKISIWKKSSPLFGKASVLLTTTSLVEITQKRKKMVQ